MARCDEGGRPDAAWCAMMHTVAQLSTWHSERMGYGGCDLCSVIQALLLGTTPVFMLQPNNPNMGSHASLSSLMHMLVFTGLSVNSWSTLRSWNLTRNSLDSTGWK